MENEILHICRNKQKVVNEVYLAENRKTKTTYTIILIAGL